MNYRTRLADHLSKYKEFNIGIMSRESQSPDRLHDTEQVLPSEYRDLNILSRFRKPFRNFTQTNPLIRLQGDFHHLNSSQALCYNLFIPFIQDQQKQPILLEALGLGHDSIIGTNFDHSYGESGEQSFDFRIKLASGSSLYFDVKLSENWFGPSYQSGLSSEYLAASNRADIVGLITGSLLKSPDVAKLIVLLSKVSYVASSDHRHLFCLFPKANPKLTEAMNLLKTSLYATNRTKVSVCYLENFVSRVMAISADSDQELHQHFSSLQRKYVIE